MVGGTDDAFTRAAPLFDAVGATVVHVGPSGSGQLVKAANQLIVAANIEALAEVTNPHLRSLTAEVAAFYQPQLGAELVL